MFQIQFINVKTSKIFTSVTTYTDRADACIHGQNYCRDRQREDGSVLFFRVISAS